MEPIESITTITSNGTLSNEEKKQEETKEASSQDSSDPGELSCELSLDMNVRDCSGEVNVIVRERCESFTSESSNITTILKSIHEQPIKVANYDLNNNNHVESHELVEIELSSNQSESSTITNREEVFEKAKQEEEDCESGSMYGHQVSGQYRLPTLDSPAPINNTQQQHFGGFQDVTPKMSFATHRMKEYFENFKSPASYESKRLYQFFKSTRTELVACLLFSLITSQALILCKTRLLIDANNSNVNWPLARREQQQQHSNMSNFTPVNLPASLTRRSQISLAGSVTVHLTDGLVLAFTVASLTQVFGHISGCHLIPSVSLALYVKGHISRARLLSYVGAQALGSGLGISLLSLLRSSQITQTEYRLMLEAAIGSSSSSYSSSSDSGSKRLLLRRKRRSTSLELPGGSQHQFTSSEAPQIVEQKVAAAAAVASLAEQHNETLLSSSSILPASETASTSSESPSSGHEVEINLKDLQGSETILLSIMEQQEEDKRVAAAAAAVGASSRADDLASRREKSIIPAIISTVNDATSTYLSQQAPAKPLPSSPVTSPAHSPLAPPIVVLSAAPLTLPRPLEVSMLPGTTSQRQHQQMSATSPYPSLPEHDSSTSSPLPLPHQERPSRRVKRTRVAPPSPERSAHKRADYEPKVQEHFEGIGSKSYVNLLELALPDEIMSANSVRECIESEFGKVQSRSAHFRLKEAEEEPEQIRIKRKKEEAELEGFAHCLSLSNSSQMFVFQLLATIMVVLTYLVNVDPRRVDLGFKSLSIGLSYFVASLLTVHSGGFYGNPFQLLFLNWFAPSSEWQSEWFIYLVTPLIAGLFGAMSHEYIDFSSAHNRNKRLHLRRSFYSLDELNGLSAVAVAAAAPPPPVAFSTHSSSGNSNGHSNAPSPAVSERILPAATELQHLQTQRQCQPQLISATQLLRENADFQQQQQPINSCRNGRIPSVRYSRQQAKIEKQPNNNNKQPKASLRTNRANSLRRSNFDSNFLISDNSTANSATLHTSPTANPRQRHQQQQQQQQQPQVAAGLTSSISNWM